MRCTGRESGTAEAEAQTVPYFSRPAVWEMISGVLTVGIMVNVFVIVFLSISQLSATSINPVQDISVVKMLYLLRVFCPNCSLAEYNWLLFPGFGFLTDHTGQMVMKHIWVFHQYYMEWTTQNEPSGLMVPFTENKAVEHYLVLVPCLCFSNVILERVCNSPQSLRGTCYVYNGVIWYSSQL